MRHPGSTLPLAEHLRRNHELQIFGAPVICLGLAFLSGTAGLSRVLGAFVAGIGVSAGIIAADGYPLVAATIALSLVPSRPWIALMRRLTGYPFDGAARLVSGSVHSRGPAHVRPLCLPILFAIGTLLCACDPGVGSGASLGTLERDRIELVAESNEPITRVLVQEGDRVETGAALIEQDTARAEVALARARADEAVARSALLEAEAGPRQQQISQARARLEASHSAVQTARFELDRELALVRRQLASQNRVDALQGTFDAAIAHRAEAQAALDELLEGTRSEAIDQARARHAAARANVQNLEITLARATTRAPVTGTVEALPFEIGERPPPGTTVAVLLASGRVYARVHVSAPLRARLPPRASALVGLDGRSEPLQGHLRWIGADAAYTPYFALNQHDRARLSYLAEVDLDDPDDTLPVGIPVEVIFPGAQP